MYSNVGLIFICDPRTISRTSDLMSSELIHNFCFADLRVFKISVQIFAEIVKKYKKTFKKEIKAILKHVLLILLKVKDFKPENKVEILKFLSSLALDSKTFAYIYLGFDLDIYEDFCIQDIIGYFLKSSQLNATSNLLAPNLVTECIQFGAKLTHKALTCLTDSKERGFIDAYVASQVNPVKSDLLVNYISPALVDTIVDRRRQAEELKAIVTAFNVKPNSIVKNIAALSFYMPGAEDPAEKLAYLFYHNPQVSKAKLGHFFGEPDEIYQSTLACYFDYEDYKNLRIDEAMSSFMNLFDLPSESQKIDRVLQKFASKFSKDNPKTMSEKCTYGLSFLVMMLQSEWHNFQVEVKMSYEQFTKLGASIEEQDKYLTEPLMKEIYETVTKKTLGSADYYRGTSGMLPVGLVEMQGVKNFNKRAKYKDVEISANTKLECEYVFLEYFRRDLADALIISLSMSYESAKSDTDCAVLSRAIIDLFEVFIILQNKSSLEQLLMAVARLTALDKLGRPFERKNVIILSNLADFIKKHCDNLTTSCLKIWFNIIFNARYYSTEPTPYDSVLKKNNFVIFKEYKIDAKLENFIFDFFNNSKNQLKIYQTVSQLFEMINSLLNDKDLEIVNRHVLTKLFDYFKHAFGQKRSLSTLQSFYNVIVSNCLNTISSLSSLSSHLAASNEDPESNMVIFIVSQLSEIVKLFAASPAEDANVFKPYEVLLSHLTSKLKRQRAAVLLEHDLPARAGDPDQPVLGVG